MNHVAEAVAAERRLLDMVRRLVRRKQDWCGLVLHLSRLAAPALRPHHRTVARAMLQDAALRHDGQVFGLAGGDIVLLCPAAGLLLPPARSAPTAAPADRSLAETLARLLHVAQPDPAQVVSVWSVRQDAGALLAYAEAQLAENLAAASAEAPPPPSDPYAAPLADGRISDLVQLQTAIVLASLPGGGVGAMRPLYREAALAMDAIAARTKLPDDPYLLRHLTGRLDRRMLEALRGEVGSGGPLDASKGLALHVNLTPQGILADGFAELARTVAGPAMAIEVQLSDAASDPDGFARAREILEGAGLRLVLDGVSYLALLLSRPASLRPDMVKLEWSPLLPGLPAAEAQAVAAALESFGAGRIVLHRAETEAALRWGLGHGIRRFQGRHVDAMLAAGRVTHCPAAATLGCTLGQCIERGAASGAAGRRGCGNLELLDAAAPPVQAGA